MVRRYARPMSTAYSITRSLAGHMGIAFVAAQALALKGITPTAVRQIRNIVKLSLQSLAAVWLTCGPCKRWCHAPGAPHRQP